MEVQSNQKRIECSFNEGGLVWLKLQLYCQIYVHRHASQKLSKCYLRPFKIQSRIGRVAYRLELPASSKIHLVIHVSQLRVFHGRDSSLQFTLIPPEFEPADDDDHQLGEESEPSQQAYHQLQTTIQIRMLLCVYQRARRLKALPYMQRKTKR
ncbi:unnamed protein product [Vicia faba]|uniref:Tf2-1-like SH3-like domain-containing protein n=1 Tax=Vicia faba TaxID=3906 RepID=A0AAV1A7K6_VICFA|nr:unnamed protein product [Vicia faba]